MKKSIALLAALCLLFSATAYAEPLFDRLLTLFDDTPSTAQQPADEYAELMNDAIAALTDAWREEYREHADFYSVGYLEIKNARVVSINDDLSQLDPLLKGDTYFSDVDCIVEFMLLDNYMNTAPYYASSGLLSNVVFYTDGSWDVPKMSYFDSYRARTFNTDFSGIIKSIVDLGCAYNAVFDNLLID